MNGAVRGTADSGFPPTCGANVAVPNVAVPDTTDFR
jgi:hypothetical protein